MTTKTKTYHRWIVTFEDGLRVLTDGTKEPKFALRWTYAQPFYRRTGRDYGALGFEVEVDPMREPVTMPGVLLFERRSDAQACRDNDPDMIRYATRAAYSARPAHSNWIKRTPLADRKLVRVESIEEVQSGPISRRDLDALNFDVKTPVVAPR
jgi:hypothetical protein